MVPTDPFLARTDRSAAALSAPSQDPARPLRSAHLVDLDLKQLLVGSDVDLQDRPHEPVPEIDLRPAIDEGEEPFPSRLLRRPLGLPALCFPEDNGGRAEVRDGSGKIADVLTGSGKDVVSSFVKGDTIQLNFRSDYSGSGEGFVVEELEVIFEDHSGL